MNPYEVLGLTRDATEADVRKAYRDISKKHHPDAGATADREKFEEAVKAYAVLGDDFSRAQYDKTGAMPSSEPDNSHGVVIEIAIRFFGMTHEALGPNNARFKNVIDEAKNKLNVEIRRLHGEIEKAQADAAKFQDVLSRLTVKEGKPNFIANHLRGGIATIDKAIEHFRQQIDLHGRALALLDDYTWRTDAVQSPTEQLGQVRGFAMFSAAPGICY